MAQVPAGFLLIEEAPLASRILLFTKTTGYRHVSMADGIELIQSAASAAGIEVTQTEDETTFRPDTLADFDAVVWLNVSGDVLDEEGREAFANYLRQGGGFAGIHGAADAEWSWPEYDNIVGARFLFHPHTQQTQTATVIKELNDPSTAPIPDGWAWWDEWYSFKRNPRGQFEVLLRIDETSYDPEDEPMGEDHPVSWRGTYGSGRTWYSALGHWAQAYEDQTFRDHLWGGVLSVLPQQS